MLRYVGDTTLAAEAQQKAEAQRQAVRAQWAGRWFRRAWLPTNQDWIGNEQIWLEPQPWAIIGGAATPPQTHELVRAIDELVRKPSPIGAMLQSKGIKLEGLEPGNFANAGVWPSINATLIWALSLADPKLAWDEWKKNTFARHAEVYPEVWYGIWSGPDYYNSTLSKHPGQTFFADPPPGKTPAGLRIFWTDYPVMNMHPHSCTLLGAAKLAGVEFTAKGVRLTPALPMESFQFRSPLVGLSTTPSGYEGWYEPAVAGDWVVELRVPPEEKNRFRKVSGNGKRRDLARGAGEVIKFQGSSARGKPLRWAVR